MNTRDMEALRAIRPDSIIFDIDGTLWDSREVVAKAWDSAFKKYLPEFGLPDITKELLTPLFGKTMEEINDALLKGVPEDRVRELTDNLYSVESEYLKKEPGRLYDGVADTVKKLSESFPLYIVSNCQKGYIEDLLETTGLGPCFKGGMCYGDTELPKGETMKFLIERHGLRRPIYVGDTEGDSEASRVAGVPFVWASYGFGSVCESGRAAKIENMSELLSLMPEEDTAAKD